MNKVAWIIFAVVVVALIGGLVAYARINNPGIDVDAVNEKAIVAASNANGQIDDHTIGKADSKVILIEYGDFQCPSCKGAHPQIKEVTEEYKDRILFIFRNFPLTSIHPNARAAAGAVEAAGIQGKYWEMHHLVFDNQDSWTNLSGTQRTNAFRGYAETLGLDLDKFIQDAGSEAVNRKISFDQALGKKSGANATPTFYLNGEKLDDETSNAIVRGSTTELKELLDKALAE